MYSSHSNNTLNIYTKNLTTQNLYNFNNTNVTNGDTILTLIGGEKTNISSTDIKATIQGGLTYGT